MFRFVFVECGPDEFRCVDMSACIVDSWRCDDWVDCDDASDEEGCCMYCSFEGTILLLNAANKTC